MAPRGWIIEVRYIQGNAEIVQRCDVAIGDPDEAITAARRVVGSADGVCLRIEEQIFLTQRSLALALSPAPFIPEFAAGAS
jgi:hypothetical protein